MAAPTNDSEDIQKQSAGSEGDSKGDAKESKDDENNPSPLANPRVRMALIIVAVIVVVGLIVLFIRYWTYGRFQQATDDAYLGADQVSIASRISGYVQEVLVTDNQVVSAGQELVRISSDDYTAMADQSRAKIAQAEALVAEAQAQRLQQLDEIRQDLAQAEQYRATLRQYQAAERFNAGGVERYTPLSAVGAETGEKLAQYASQLEQSRAQAEAARAQLAGSNAQVEGARHDADRFDAQIRSGEAQADEARAQLAANLVNVNATSVTTQIGGRVGNRTVRVGQYIQVGTRMMTVVPVDALYIDANFKETQIGLMRVGQPVTIDIDALTREEINGTLESFSPGTGSRFALVPTDNATGNFTKIVQRVPVRIHLDAGPRARQVLIPGLSAKVSVDTRGARDDAAAQKDEAKRSKDARRREHDREVQRDRQLPREGAGQ